METQDLPERPLVLTIAGFDPSGGAGVLADVKTLLALQCRAGAVVTSITFQNSEGVLGALHQSAATVRGQLLPLMKNHPASVKTGMLPTSEIVHEVAHVFREHSLPAPVVDPVIVSSSGYRLMEEEALQALVAEILPLARVVTPNIGEAEQLTGKRITSELEMREAAVAIRKMGARAVLIKGGHLGATEARGFPERLSEEAIDVLDDEGVVTVFRDARVANADLHGTGCMMSAAVAACLGKKMSLEDSVRVAKQFVLSGIRESVVPSMSPGKG